uniref:Uncharacterized protein n=1 Tax=Davidia involucrata TaxID=16924 RepID=A0A5B6YU22_DAVIN
MKNTTYKSYLIHHGSSLSLSLSLSESGILSSGSGPKKKKELKSEKMGRGVSAGGGQSSLGYLFGSGETTNNSQAATNNSQPTNNSQAATNNSQAARNQGHGSNNGPSEKSTVASQPLDNTKQIPAGIPGNKANNYFRADGQNCGNFITDRPSTKVHAAPGGGSSLGYLFGGGEK